MPDNKIFTYVRALGAIICIVTLNTLVILAHLDPNVPVPRWSIYILVILIGGLLGLDALLEVSPVKIQKK